MYVSPIKNPVKTILGVKKGYFMSPILMVLSVFFVSTSSVSDYKVFVTKNKYEADLWVWNGKHKYESLGKEEVWFRTKNKNESSFSVRFVKTRYNSDLVIFYTKNRYEAGWRKNHPLKNNLIIPK